MSLRLCPCLVRLCKAFVPDRCDGESYSVRAAPLSLLSLLLTSPYNTTSTYIGFPRSIISCRCANAFVACTNMPTRRHQTLRNCRHVYTPLSSSPPPLTSMLQMGYYSWNYES
ncbi:hypothetical protein C8J57DRAFT_1385525 [Mycena rebaudengoi]|nr:hypothetical protein C8J57DRAFT_1385525 [Mycena rebaudengoi]